MNPERILHLYDTINNASVPQILEAIIRLNNEDDIAQFGTLGEQGTFKRDPIHLHINSGGGIIYDCFAACSVIESSKTPIYGYVHGYAMSSGLTLFGKCHRRFGGKYSRFMIHEPSEKLGEGKLSDMENRIAETNKLRNIRNRMLSEQTGTPVSVFEKLDQTDYFFDVYEAIELGVVHEII